MMALGGGECCCGGCGQIPDDLSLEANDLQPVAAYCCECLPLQICATYNGPEGSFSGILDIVQPCSAMTYHYGELGVDGSVVDVRIDWIVENETCYLEMSSSALPASRAEIDEQARQVICPDCQPCEASPPITIQVAESMSLALRPAANKSLAGAKERCCDCPDPCDPPEQYLEPICGNCSCICESACIAVLENGEPVANGVGRLCNNQYQAAGMTISLVGEEGCCSLELTSADSYQWDTQPDNVAIDDIINPCPRPTGVWLFDDIATDKNIMVFFTCSGCGGCDTVLTPCGCAAPRILTLDVDAGGCFPEVSLTLVNDGEAGEWKGGNDIMQFELGCNGAEWELSFTINNCVDSEFNPEMKAGANTVDCDPFLLTFSANIYEEFPEIGPFCCFGGNGGTISVTVS